MGSSTPAAGSGLTLGLADEIGTSDEAEYEASGSTKIGDEKVIDGGAKTYPERFSVSEMGTMRMDTDATRIPTVSVLSEPGKRKISALHNDTSDISLLSSEPTATSDVTTSEHAGKKRSTGKDRQPRKISARKAAEISNATVLHGMQGTMNRVTEIFEKSVTLPLDPQSAVRTDALHFLQTREDNLSLDDRTALVQLFMKEDRKSVV